MARIGIDARFYGSVGKGLGRYTEKLIKNLEEIDFKNQYFILLRKENFDEYAPKNSNFQKVLADFQWYTFTEQIKMPFLLYKLKLDLVHFPHFNIPLLYRKKNIITIHDLILLHFPTLKGTMLNPLFYWIKFLAYKFTILIAIHRSTKILTVSEFTKNDILQHYNILKEKIIVAYEACEDFCYLQQKNQEQILQNYGIIKPYILYVGNAYPHKNLPKLIEAFEAVQKEKTDLNLVLVGKEDFFYKKLKQLVKKRSIKNIVFPGFVPDCDLDFLYKNAQLYVFPSLYEGFGLPPLEAMAKGVAVLSSDHPCMKEILQDAAVFMNARDKNEIAQKILQLLDDKETLTELRQKGYLQVAKYSWKKMAKSTLKVYEK